MTLTLLTIATILTVLLLNPSPSHAVECVKRDGELVLRDNGHDLSPGPFHCMRIRAQQKKTTLVEFQKMTRDGAQCTVKSHMQENPRTKYTKSEMHTGAYCKYKCSDDNNGFKCLYKHHKDGVCACKPGGPRVVTVAVVGGKGPDALGETCEDKWEGYEFADAVACTRIQGEFKKKRLVEVGNGMCVERVESLVETRFMRTEKVDRNLQGCVYVCKKELIKCIGKRKKNAKQCKCGRVGLRKVLIGMNEAEVEGRVDQTKCKGGDCGPCGVCVLGECKLKRKASKGNNCACGEICPNVDRRKGGKGGKIFCEPNMRLGCRTVPKWMRQEKPGTRKPDLCTSGPVDAADTCGCAPGYRELHERYGETKCIAEP